jgi:hypothetical protein
MCVIANPTAPTRNSLRAKTDCQRKPTVPLLLSSSERLDPEYFACL